MSEVDPGFFMRLNQSRTIEGDPIFTKDFTKADYYDRFPTIYHLRAYLTDTDEQADLRLVYLAIHNIVKHRGNFLRQGEKLTAKTAKTSDASSVLATPCRLGASRGNMMLQKSIKAPSQRSSLMRGLLVRKRQKTFRPL